MTGGGRLNLSEVLLDEGLSRHADLVALRFPGGEWTYSDLARRAGAAAAWLAGRGVGRGSTVVIALHDSAEWVAVFLGAARLGAVCALASPAHPRERLTDAVGRLDAALVLSDEPSVACGFPRAGSDDVAAACACDADGPAAAPTRADDPCYLLLTSGTTGRSKWAMHRHRDIPFCIATYGRRVIRLRPGDVTWSVAALATSYGLGNSCYFPLGAGACAWIAPGSASPAGAARACREGGATALFGVPTSWARLARHVDEGRVAGADLAGVRLAVSAGEPLPAAVWEHVRRATGLGLVNGLGCSEATNLYLSDRPGSPRPGTVGWPVPGFALRIVPLPGREEAHGEGELWVRGGSVMPGYLGDPEATARAMSDGWLCTGDIVRRERDGSHTFLGRTGDRLKVGALWVDPARVEAVIMGEAAVAAAAVMGVEDDEGLLRLVAVVGAPGGDEGGLLLARLRERLREGLAAHETPRAVVVLPRLPTSASGKVSRGELRTVAHDALAHTTH